MYIDIDRSKELPIIRQIYNNLRNKILNNELKSGERMPSSRKLSSDIKVSRNVVLEAYSLLESEGYIYTIPQSAHMYQKEQYLILPYKNLIMIKIHMMLQMIYHLNILT